MNRTAMTTLVALIIVVFVASLSVFRVNEKQSAVQLRFGALVNDNLQPGLHFKIPFVDDVRHFDARVLTVDARPEDFYTIQKKRLIVDSYVKYRILNVGDYYRATGGDERTAQQRIAARANDGLRNEFGTRTLAEVVSG